MIWPVGAWLTASATPRQTASNCGRRASSKASGDKAGSASTSSSTILEQSASSGRKLYNNEGLCVSYRPPEDLSRRQYVGRQLQSGWVFGTLRRLAPNLGKLTPRLLARRPLWPL